MKIDTSTIGQVFGNSRTAARYGPLAGGPGRAASIGLRAFLRRPAALLVGAAVCFLTASCKVGPNYQRPAVEMPTTFKSATTQEAPAPRLATNWWTLYGDAELTALEEAAVRDNPGITAAMARVLQARAATRVVQSQFYPLITFNPGVQRQTTKAGTFNNTQVPFDLSYEVDVWGQVRRQVESAKATAQASAIDFQVVLQTLEADVAQDYFTLRSLDDQDQIIARNVGSFEKQVALTQTQFKAGLATQLDVAQAQAQLDATRALEIDTRRQRADLEHALAILLGRAPAEFTLAVKPLDAAPPLIPAGMPGDLLRRRPDVAEAEQNLIAANAQVGVAVSEFYPTIQLTGLAGFESVHLSDALSWQSRILSFGPSVSFPVFEGGRLEANLAQTKARYDELLANFRTTLLGAFGDVEDSLTDLHMRADAAQAQRRAVEASRQAVHLAEVQYQRGLVNYLPVIDAERTLLTNELTAAQLLSQRMVSSVLLIKALGGGWDPANPATRPAAPATRPANPATQARP